jgi:hypothetical protein
LQVLKFADLSSGHWMKKLPLEGVSEEFFPLLEHYLLKVTNIFHYKSII